MRPQPSTHVRKLQPVLAVESPLADLVVFLMLFARQRYYGYIRCFHGHAAIASVWQASQGVRPEIAKACGGGAPEGQGAEEMSGGMR